jgi:hypothetical protein
VRHRPVSDRCHGEGPRRRRLLLRLTSPRTRRVGWEAWPSCVRVSPARPAGARVPHPLPWQRLARPHACAPVSRSCALSHRVHPSQPPPRHSASGVARAFVSVSSSSHASLTALIAFESVPSSRAAARPQPPVLSVPCGAGWCPVARGASGTPWWGARQGGRCEGCGPTPGAGTSGSRVAWGGRTRSVEKAV